MSDERGLVDTVPTEVYLAYEDRAKEIAARSATEAQVAIKNAILRFVLEARLSNATPEQTAKEAAFVAAGGAERVEDHYSNQRFCMFAIAVVDGETGARHWECTEDGGRGEVSHEAVVELAANTFAPGTTIEVREPLFDHASLPSSKLGDATQKTGQSAENAEGAGSSPVGDAYGHHTPAPWVANGLSIYAPGCVDTDYGPVWGSIAVCQDTVQTDADGRTWSIPGDGAKNAAIIAAAPELLSALERLVEARRDVELMSAAKDAYAAIAKAHGQVDPGLHDDRQSSDWKGWLSKE